MKKIETRPSASSAARQRLARAKQAIASVTPAPAALTPNERRVLAAFKTMDQRHQAENLAKLERDAGDYPGRPRPHLLLVAGGVQ